MLYKAMKEISWVTEARIPWTERDVHLGRERSGLAFLNQRKELLLHL